MLSMASSAAAVTLLYMMGRAGMLCVRFRRLPQGYVVGGHKGLVLPNGQGQDRLPVAVVHRS